MQPFPPIPDLRIRDDFRNGETLYIIGPKEGIQKVAYQFTTREDVSVYFKCDGDVSNQSLPIHSILILKGSELAWARTIVCKAKDMSRSNDSNTFLRFMIERGRNGSGHMDFLYWLTWFERVIMQIQLNGVKPVAMPSIKEKILAKIQDKTLC